MKMFGSSCNLYLKEGIREYRLDGAPKNSRDTGLIRSLSDAPKKVPSLNILNFDQIHCLEKLNFFKSIPKKIRISQIQFFGALSATQN